MASSRPYTEQFPQKRLAPLSSPSPSGFRGTATPQPLSLTSRPGFLINQRVPTASDIAFWQGRIVKSKNFDSEFNTDIPVDRPVFPQSYASPRITLKKVKSGENLGPKWFEEDQFSPPPHIQKAASRYGLTIRPDTYAKIVPSAPVDFHKMPATTSKQWERIDIKKDVDLGNFGLNSTNAFRTYWMKHNTLKHRKFFNTDHPEYMDMGLANHRRKDHIVVYRESMLGVKDMMISTWKAKK